MKRIKTYIKDLQPDGLNEAADYLGIFPDYLHDVIELREMGDDTTRVLFYAIHPQIYRNLMAFLRKLNLSDEQRKELAQLLITTPE